MLMPPQTLRNRRFHETLGRSRCPERLFWFVMYLLSCDVFSSVLTYSRVGRRTLVPVGLSSWEAPRGVVEGSLGCGVALDVAASRSV